MQKTLETSQFIKLPKGSEPITVLADPKRHVHPIHLLKQYTEEHPISVKNNDKKTIQKELASNKGLVIILIENFAELPVEIDEPVLIQSNQTEKEWVEGSFIIKTIKINQAFVVLIAGSGVPGVVYATNELGQNYMANHEATITIPMLDIDETPSLLYRIFFTFDHSTNWDVENSGQQEIGFANPYLKTKEAFLRDYKRIVDFMSLNRLNGLIIFGFLRDSHGGIEAAKELCQYANERGVRIIPFVGINAYGAVYWEGDHEYNLSNWLERNPHLKANIKRLVHFELPDLPPVYVPKTHYLDKACPSKKENEVFNENAIKWLAENFEIGGINFETGDYGNCECKDCIERRAKNKQWSHDEMAALYPRLFKAAKSKRPDLWTICEAYWDNILNLDALEPLKQVPQDAVFQYCTNRGYLVDQVFKQLTKDHVAKVPGSQKILRTHMGSQWQNERYTLVAERYAKMMQVAHATGMHGATIFAEPSDFSVVNEINYLAFARFGYNANLTWDQFVKNDLAPLLGGEKEAKQYLALLDPARHQECKSLNECLVSARTIAASLDNEEMNNEKYKEKYKENGDLETHRRWIWLQNYLHQKLSMKQSILDARLRKGSAA